MGAGYEILKIATAAGTLFSIYGAFTDTLLLEDLLFVILLAAALVLVSKERACKPTSGLGKGAAKQESALEKALEEELSLA